MPKKVKYVILGAIGIVASVVAAKVVHDLIADDSDYNAFDTE